MFIFRPIGVFTVMSRVASHHEGREYKTGETLPVGRPASHTRCC
jgi:hypothetical protein